MILLSLLVLDQFSKFIVRKFIAFNPCNPPGLDDTIGIVNVSNTEGNNLRMALIQSVIITCLFCFRMRKTSPIAGGLYLAGSLGNGFDCFFRRSVTDFLLVRFKGVEGIANLADIMIFLGLTIGVIAEVRKIGGKK